APANSIRFHFTHCCARYRLDVIVQLPECARREFRVSGKLLLLLGCQVASDLFPNPRNASINLAAECQERWIKALIDLAQPIKLTLPRDNRVFEFRSRRL